MHINKLAKDHIAFCKRKGLPMENTQDNRLFLASRIYLEVIELHHEVEVDNKEKTLEEATDVLLQVIQLMAVIDPDIESAIKKKIIINKDRTWKKQL